MATFTVTTLDDSGPGSLRDAILQANGTPGPDRIEFAAGLTGTITLMSSLPDITDDLVIDGPGAAILTISGGGTARILTVDRGVNVSIDGLTFENGGAGEGGAMMNSGRLTLTGCIFRQNAAGFGGAILNIAAVLIVRQCTFEGNHADSAGGAISNRLGDVMVEGSSFLSNTAARDGGAIDTNLGTTTVRTSQFAGNTAGMAGGALSTMANRLEVVDCTLEDNAAGSLGGAVYVEADLEVTRCTFRRNSALVSGGAIAAQSGGVRMAGSILAYNAAGVDGGAVLARQAACTITRCTLNSNRAGDNGGAIAVTDMMLLLTDSDLVGNSAGSRGGGIFSTRGSVKGNWTGMQGCNLVENTAGLTGGGLCSVDGVTEVEGSAIVRNRADLGGGLTIAGVAMARLLNVTLSQNRALQGGAVLALCLMVEASFITVNETVGAPPGSAAVAGLAGNVYVANSIFASTATEAGQPLPNGSGVTDLGGNFSTDDSCPGFTVVSAEELALGPLVINAPGRTYTHALGKGSVAVDAARDCRDAALQPVRADQRGVRRPQGRACDAGAYELAPEHKPKHADHDDSSGEDDASDCSGR